MTKFKKISLSLVVATTLGLSGCGGGGGSTASVDDVQTGTFVDAPVQGLKYETATQSGYTDENGNFKYKTGETVTFKIGTLSLGSATGSGAINPLDLSGDTSFASISTKAKNIAMLLQNLDQNRTDTNKIVISSALKEHNFGDLNLSSTALEASMNTILADSNISANIDQINNTVITQANANIVMTNYLKDFIAGTYNGTVHVTKNYYSGFTCTDKTNYDVVVTSSGNNFTISAPTTITENGIATTRSITWTTSTLNDFSTTYSNVPSPLSRYSYKLESISFNGKKLTGSWYMKDSVYGNLCEGTYSLSK